MSDFRASNRSLLRVLTVALGAGASAATGPACGQEMTVTKLEYNVKAVSLYAFGRYITWPPEAFEDSASEFVIGLLGGNPFGDALERIAAKKKVNDRPISVRILDSPRDAGQCHIVFVSRSVERADEERLMEQVAGKPVLVVGESPGFTERGGVIGFYQVGNNVRFEINPDRSLESHLSLDAKLLSLGTKTVTR
jgi:hypothetical protein